MRIIDLQRRLREVGRIRIGEQVATSNGKSRPKKLEHFRLTSRDELVIQAAAEQWGGTAQPWEGAPDGPQWEVFTESASLPVIVPPGDMSFSQAYEQWTAGGCKVRCDGRYDHLADKPCHCDPENRACDIHTRLSVMLPDLPGVGVWRLDTQGYYGAVELGGIVDLVASHSERGIMLPARLRLEQRSVKRIDQGKVVTRNFAVPVLDVDVHPLALTGGGLDPDTGELTHSSRPALPAGSITPVPPVDGSLAPTIAEQLHQVDQPAARAPRANAAQAVPATGLKPRTAQAAAADAAAEQIPAEVVESLRLSLNALGADARRAFLAEFGCPPAELPIARVEDAVAFVAALTATHVEPPPDGGGADLPEAHDSPPGDEGEGMVSAAAPDGTIPEPVGVSVQDVARLANDVFKADYEAAPRGQKTKVVDRLRHAIVWAQTAKSATSTKQLPPSALLAVHTRLRDIQAGRMTYATDPEGVTFTINSEPPVVVRVDWAELDAAEAA